MVPDPGKSAFCLRAGLDAKGSKLNEPEKLITFNLKPQASKLLGSKAQTPTLRVQSMPLSDKDTPENNTSGKAQAEGFSNM